MKKFILLMLCVLLQPMWVAAQKGFVKGKLGEELDDLMIGFSKEGYSGAVLVVRGGEAEGRTLKAKCSGTLTRTP